MVDKQDSTWNYKTTTLLYNIFQGRQIWKQTYYLEKVDMKEDNQNTQMLKEELWIRRTTNQDRTPIILLR